MCCSQNSQACVTHPPRNRYHGHHGNVFPWAKQNKSAFWDSPCCSHSCQIRRTQPKRFVCVVWRRIPPIYSTPTNLGEMTAAVIAVFRKTERSRVILLHRFYTGRPCSCVCVCVCVWLHIILTNFHKVECGWSRHGNPGRDSMDYVWVVWASQWDQTDAVWSPVASERPRGHYWSEMPLVSLGKLPSGFGILHNEVSLGLMSCGSLWDSWPRIRVLKKERKL